MTQLVEIGQDESWELASGQQFCCVAWATGAGPTVIPVNYIVHGETLWFRTAAESSLVREVDDEPIAILIDEVDTETRLGWSVQMRGVAHVHWHPEEVPAPVRSLHSWASGARPLWIELRPDEVHGRRLIPSD